MYSGENLWLDIFVYLILKKIQKKVKRNVWIFNVSLLGHIPKLCLVEVIINLEFCHVKFLVIAGWIFVLSKGSVCVS